MKTKTVSSTIYLRKQLREILYDTRYDTKNETVFLLNMTKENDSHW